MARAPFSELPLELKEMIVAMASDQEDAYKGRVTSLADRAGHINCLNSLSLVNRELSELTARHRFNVLSAGRAELSGEYSLDAGLEEGTFFETTIFPRHRHHMKELVFKDTDYFDVSNNAMAFIDRLPALRALEFNENSVLRMFDGYRFLMRFRPDGSIASDERRLVYVALKIETLILREFEPLWAIEFARAFTNLRSLSLVELRDGDNMEETQALARGIATLRQLRSLSIELDRDAWANQWSPEAVAPLLLDPPPLKSLHLLWFPLQSIPLLTSIFVSSLETLCIHLRNQDNISPEELEELSDLSSLSPVQLPLLTSLTITSKYSSDLDDISRLLLSSSTLTELVCNLDDISLDPTDEASAPLLQIVAGAGAGCGSGGRLGLVLAGSSLCFLPSSLFLIIDDLVTPTPLHLLPRQRPRNSLPRLRFRRARPTPAPHTMARASFTTLPLELKEMIVSMASDQEDSFKERVRSLTERAGHVNGLSSLALVNKELRDLAAEQQFKVLPARRSLGMFFEDVIFPRHGHRVRELVFAYGDGWYQVESAKDLMSQLPALRVLRLHGHSASRLFGHDVPLGVDYPCDEVNHNRKILLSIAHKIETLDLTDFDPCDAAQLARAFKHLKSLSLVSLAEADHPEEIRDLAKSIASLRQLETLSIHLGGDGAWVDKWTRTALAPLRRNPPPIRTLHLLWFPLNYFPHIVSIFASTLETLHIQPKYRQDIDPYLNEFDEIDCLDHPTPVHLPLLTSLTISSESSSNLDEISRLLLSSSTLTELVCQLDDISLDPSDESSAPLSRLLDSQSSLRRVQLEKARCLFPTRYGQDLRGDPLPLSFVSAYATLVHSRGLDRSVLLDPAVTRFFQVKKVDYTENEAEVLKAALGKTLAFAMGELERLGAEGRVGDAVRWVEALRPFEERRLAWRD
ncbi:hypothetical protein RQP46_002518 [Phenoliferia psychrophenolica]